MAKLLVWFGDGTNAAETRSSMFVEDESMGVSETSISNVERWTGDCSFVK